MDFLEDCSSIDILKHNGLLINMLEGLSNKINSLKKKLTFYQKTINHVSSSDLVSTYNDIKQFIRESLKIDLSTYKYLNDITKK
jgi:hypothetical protein